MDNSLQTSISSEQISAYRKMLISEMIELGAADNDIELVSDDLVINSIMNGRAAKDVAWAILQ